MHTRAPVDAISAKIADMGFNCVRLVYALDTLYENPVVNPERVTENPQLIGKTAMEVMDSVVASLTRSNIMVVLNNHVGFVDMAHFLATVSFTCNTHR